MEAKDSSTEPSPSTCCSTNLGRDERCPLCGGDNQCRVAKGHLYKGPCWCHQVIVPGAVLARLASEQIEQACLCRSCLETVADVSRRVEGMETILTEVRRIIASRQRPEPDPEDYYLDEFGNTVFTAAYHLKRGNCCGSGCRHCPY